MKAVKAMAVALLVASGCAVTDVDPPNAKARTGYVDFYADDASPLCWQIQNLKGDETKGKILFETFKPITNGIVRLALKPGDYRFAVTFLNRAIVQPGLVNAVVEDGKITPVRVDLIETGETLLEKKESRVGGTFYGRTGRSTRIRASEGATFRVEAEAQEAISYRPKERMPFAIHIEQTRS